MSIAKLIKILTAVAPIITGVDMSKVNAIIKVLEIVAEEEPGK